MVIDSSAILAILLKENEGYALSCAMEKNDERLMSVAGVLECSIVMNARFGDAGERELDVLIRKSKIEIMPFTEQQSEIARRAFRKFGKGRHPAALNFGDCIVYALAKDLGEPLLFKGDDFSKTDVVSAL
jgi:ribonuclease VapC